MMLGGEIEAAGESAEMILKDSARGQIRDLVKMLKKFNNLILHLEKAASGAIHDRAYRDFLACR